MFLPVDHVRFNGSWDDLPMSVVQVKEKARHIIHVPRFKASDGWVYKFFQRNHFTLRVKTSLSHNNLVGEIRAYLQKFRSREGLEVPTHSNQQHGWDPGILWSYTKHLWQPYIKKTAEQLALPDSSYAGQLPMHTLQRRLKRKWMTMV